MSLRTTVIGSYPKPPGTPVPGWFQDRKVNPNDPTKTYTDFIRAQSEDTAKKLDEATRAVVREQVQIGIDIPTDGEVRREHYIYYHLRHIGGFDFDKLTVKTMRDGSWQAQVPTVVAALTPGEPFLPQDWRTAQAVTAHPVKITIPGPLTIIDSTADAHYGDNETLAMALADVINTEVRVLADAGCTWIQIDEPIFARHPRNALDYGVAALSRCFQGVAPSTSAAVILAALTSRIFRRPMRAPISIWRQPWTQHRWTRSPSRTPTATMTSRCSTNSAIPVSSLGLSTSPKRGSKRPRRSPGA